MPTTDVPETAQPRRGFVYFCEHALRYVGGGRALLFFAPYLLGMILLEPRSHSATVTQTDVIRPWLPLLIYLLVLPPIWRGFLLLTGLWRRKKSRA